MAYSNGLITKIITDNFEKELMSYCTTIAGFSRQVSRLILFCSPVFERFVLDAFGLIHEAVVKKL